MGAPLGAREAKGWKRRKSMAHFYATVSGTRDSEATKTGSKQSGMSAHLRGWHLGVRVELRHKERGL